MIPVFQAKKTLNTWSMPDDVVKRYNEHKSNLPDGEYEIVIRPKQTWDVAQMRKYFHGPVLEFVRLEVKRAGHVITKGQLKEDFKQMFGPTEPKKTLQGTKLIPRSTSTYDFDEYRDFINDISDWCKDKLKCDLPDTSEVE